MNKKIRIVAVVIVVFAVVVALGRPFVRELVESAEENMYERQNNESFYEGNTNSESESFNIPVSEEPLEDVDTNLIRDGAGVGAAMEPKAPANIKESSNLKTEGTDILIEGLVPILEQDAADEQTKEQNVTKEMGESYSSPVCFVVQYDDGVIESFAAKVESEYAKVPENVRMHFQTGGWTLLVSAQPLAQRIPGYGNSILGFTDSDCKTIFIDNREKAIASVVHEMGHYIDWANGLPSESDEFLSIYNTEVVTFCSIHSTHSANTSTPMEYFAEFYEVMIRNPESVAKDCPQTYEFVQYYQSQL